MVDEEALGHVTVSCSLFLSHNERNSMRMTASRQLIWQSCRNLMPTNIKNVIWELTAAKDLKLIFALQKHHQQ